MANKINKNYVSEIDQYLEEFDRTHPPSASQLAESNKYKIVSEKRDNPDSPQDEKKIWTQF